MMIKLEKIVLEDYEFLQNMARFYVYDMSKYCGSLSGWSLPKNGLYECFDLKCYITHEDRYAYFVTVKGERAGFVMVNKIASSVDVDWTIGEFFILGQFQGRGVGQKAVSLVFKELPGVWEVGVMPENTGAFSFWSTVLKKLADQREIQSGYTAVPTEILEPEPHIMNNFKIETL
ncbi:MAG TPA: GNAT family N-acetyltransferase [Holosporales bacterium]|nr:GNAT family N-acetyltransferase [Holosporales bacterium]